MKKIKFKKLIKWIILLLVILGVIYYFVHKSQPVESNTQITTASAALGTVESVITSTGTLSPANEYEVKSLVKGTILSAPFEEGDAVKKGSTLYQISTSDVDNSIKSAELNMTKAKLAYQECLDKKKDLSQTSKYSGYIKKLYVKKGDKVQAGATIADIYNGSTLYLDLMFPAYEVKKSWIGKTASIQMDSTEETIKGKVTSVSSMTETMSGAVLAKKVTIRINNTYGISSSDTASATVNGVSSNNSATFRAETESTLVAAADGSISRLYIKEGDYVKANSNILTFSSKDLDNQIRDAKIAVKEAELSLKSQKSQLNLYTIDSPISGTVISKTKKQDDTIDPTTDTQAGPMAIIYDLSYLTFQMNIDELQIESVKVGQKVEITSEALPGKTFKGMIDRISLKGTTNNGITSYPVIVRVKAYGSLLPGMNVNGRIIIERAENVLTIPSSALQRGNLVYVQSKDSNTNKTAKKASKKGADSSIPEGFKSVKVKIGLNDGANVEIKSGLKEGDVVYLPFDDSVESTYEFN